MELSKLTQMERESIIAVSIDCFGAIPSKEAELICLPNRHGLLKLDSQHRASSGMRANMSGTKGGCRGCRHPRGQGRSAVGTRIDAYRGESLSHRSRATTTRCRISSWSRAGSAESFPSQTWKQFSKDFEKCIMCMNCRDMCPVCYCIDCVFHGDEYVPKGDAFINKMLRLEATLPLGKELFHFIRMYHVSQTCVACGACEEACPQRIPLTKYMKGTSERLQKLFSYMSGRSFDETIPYLTFLEDELKDAED